MPLDHLMQPVIEIAGLDLGVPIAVQDGQGRHDLVEALVFQGRDWQERRARHLWQQPVEFLAHFLEIGFAVRNEVEF